MTREERRNVLDGGTVTIAEAEKFLGLSRTTLYLLMERGDLPYVKPPGIRARRIPRTALVRLLEAGLHVRNA